jgi:hypothetical protein
VIFEIFEVVVGSVDKITKVGWLVFAFATLWVLFVLADRALSVDAAAVVDEADPAPAAVPVVREPVDISGIAQQGRPLEDR